MLEAIETEAAGQAKNGRPAIEHRLAAIEDELPTADTMTRLRLLQERRDQRAALVALDNGPDIAALEAGFVAVAASYGARHAISYETWREMNVPATVLGRAGIKRSR